MRVARKAENDLHLNRRSFLRVSGAAAGRNDADSASAHARRVRRSDSPLGRSGHTVS